MYIHRKDIECHVMVAEAFCCKPKRHIDMTFPLSSERTRNRWKVAPSKAGHPALLTKPEFVAERKIGTGWNSSGKDWRGNKQNAETFCSDMLWLDKSLHICDIVDLLWISPTMLSDSLLSNSRPNQHNKQLRPKQNPWPASQWFQWISA